jgi:hypothetical protein
LGNSNAKARTLFGSGASWLLIALAIWLIDRVLRGLLSLLPLGLAIIENSHPVDFPQQQGFLENSTASSSLSQHAVQRIAGSEGYWLDNMEFFHRKRALAGQ